MLAQWTVAYGLVIGQFRASERTILLVAGRTRVRVAARRRHCIRDHSERQLDCDVVVSWHWRTERVRHGDHAAPRSEGRRIRFRAIISLTSR